MQRGDSVQVVEYGGGKVIRRVIADRGKTVEICNEVEYGAAVSEERRPRGVGVLRQFIEDADEQICLAVDTNI